MKPFIPAGRPTEGMREVAKAVDVTGSAHKAVYDSTVSFIENSGLNPSRKLIEECEETCGFDSYREKPVR